MNSIHEPMQPNSRRLCASGLSASEAGLLRALLTLRAHSPHGRPNWQYVSSCEQADAKLVPGEDEASLRLTLSDGRSALVSRPLSVSTLEHGLNSLDAAVPQDSAQPLGAARAHERLASENFVQKRYRLRRWPPAELLRNDVHRVRLAHLLSVRALSVTDLQRLSGLPQGTCESFVRSLQSLGLIQLAAASGTAAPVAARQAVTREATPDQAGRESGTRTLVSSIRRKLGLERAAS